MSVYMLRRRKLGRTSCGEISRFAQRIDGVIRNDQPVPQDASMIIRWGTTSNLPIRGEANIINTAEAIHRVGDKAGFRRVLMGYHNAVGPLLCPQTYFDLVSIAQPDCYPLVVRPRVHAQGKHVYLVSTRQELIAAIDRCGEGWYASKYINKVSEYRVTFVQGRVAWVAKKTPGNPQDVAWNVARGGRFDNVRFDDWPLKAVKLSREAFMLSGLDFGAVDVMIDGDDQPYVLEINSAPSQTSPYRQECMAKCFDYLIEHGKASIPVVEQRGGWKKFIHPALSQEALMV